MKTEIEIFVMNIADIINQPIEKYLYFFLKKDKEKFCDINLMPTEIEQFLRNFCCVMR